MAEHLAPSMAVRPTSVVLMLLMLPMAPWMAGCVTQDDHMQPYVRIEDDGIYVILPLSQKVFVGETVHFGFVSGKHDSVHIARWENGTWSRYATVEDHKFRPSLHRWTESGNYTIYLDGGTPGDGLHANLTIHEWSACRPPDCSFYPADEYWEHEHEDGALHYHRHNETNETR